MNILQNVSLRDYSTMRLGGSAAFAVAVSSRIELEEALAWAEQQNVPVIMIGSGSNIVWRDEGFNGLLIINQILRFEESIDGDDYYVTIGAGENWDNVVERVVEKGVTGLEYLSLIPGTAGATPVQNVGAYGQEISNVLVSVEAYDSHTRQFISIPGFECSFGYRTSRFKEADRGRFFITAITLHLRRGNPEPPFYRALQQYLTDNDITEFTPSSIRQAVIHIRQSKLPDPAIVANNGSFFGNPIVDEAQLVQLQAAYPDIPHWPTSDGRVKLSAAWLLETAGFKNIHDAETGMATWPKQPLVLVNERAQSTAQLLAFRKKILDTIKTKFDITLEQEPELLPLATT
ncbi:MAG TPA: UDP-N-acetylmuramate dehydrogenase [Candidatus Saccharimonadales bacterium]|nr:UDP-N-acetylmuramate dehydrogenase [Candidatus Saccharimonadales bacterium]